MYICKLFIVYLITIQSIFCSAGRFDEVCSENNEMIEKAKSKRLERDSAERVLRDCLETSELRDCCETAERLLRDC